MRVYLDACCLARLTDDQSQVRVRQEAEAVEHVFTLIRRGIVELISSQALQDEVGRNPSAARRLEAEMLLSFAAIDVRLNASIAQRARELSSSGYGAYDALHLAAGEFAKADVLLSTDDRFIKTAARGEGNPTIIVQNPISWIKEYQL